LFQEYGEIIDVEIIFNERGSKVCTDSYAFSIFVALSLKSCAI